MTDDTLPIRIAALYQFTPFDDCEAIRQPLAKLCCARGVKGILLLAREGINGTIAGTEDGIDAVLAHIRALPGCDRLEVKESRAEELPFLRMKVRIKREIVTMGQPDLDPRVNAGKYVKPADWNALISRDDTILIDTRNDYEVDVGTFDGAIDPKIKSFRDFPKWFRDHRDELMARPQPPKVAMFCTGGIRCEKATAFLKAEGLDEVYHLEGGILKYLETVSQADSLWQGECFVFDQRVTVTHDLERGTHDLCHACRRPINDAAKASPFYVEGVSCPACHDERDDKQRQRYAQREHQSQLANARGELHLGAVIDKKHVRRQSEN